MDEDCGFKTMFPKPAPLIDHARDHTVIEAFKPFDQRQEV